MNTETVAVKRRVVRSDLEQGAQCVILWVCAIYVVWTIHTNQLGFDERYILAGYVGVAIFFPCFCLFVLKLVQLAKFAVMRRSKRYEFIDDVHRKTRGQKQKLVMRKFRDEEGRLSIELGTTKSNLPLLFALYALVVLTSLLYKNEIYFVVALVLTGCLVASSAIVLVKSGFSINKALERGNTSLSKDERDEIAQTENYDADHVWVSIPSLDSRIRFSRMWALAHLYYLGIWIPLVPAIPLIGLLFGDSFWLGFVVGTVYVFVIEICTLITLFNVFERLFPYKGSA